MNNGHMKVAQARKAKASKPQAKKRSPAKAAAKVLGETGKAAPPRLVISSRCKPDTDPSAEAGSRR